MPTSLRSRLFTFALAGVAASALAPSVAPGNDGRKGARSSWGAAAEAPSKAERAAGIALAAVGVPYHWGGESPSSGFDCSGLVRWAYGRVGVELPHNSYALYREGRRVSVIPGQQQLRDLFGCVRSHQVPRHLWAQK